MNARTAVAIVAAALTGCSMPNLFPLGAAPEPAAEAFGGLKPASSRDTGSPARCVNQSEASGRARQLIVLIRTRFSQTGATQFGSGIVVGMRDGQLYILTARHVVAQDHGGKPTIEVAVGETESRYLPAQLHPFAPTGSPDAMNDIAVVQVDARRTAEAVTFKWDVLRGNVDMFDLRDVSIIGNPGARGKSTTPPGPAQYFNSNELRVNSGVMEQGYSGGGAFDRQLRLVGLVFEDRGSFAAAYPIEPVLKSLIVHGVPVDLKVASAIKKGVHFVKVFGEPTELSKSIDQGIRKTLRLEGLDPDCDAADSYRLSVTVKGWRVSGSTSAAEVQSYLAGPTGAQLLSERHQLHFTHSPLKSAWDAGDAIEEKVQPMTQELLKKLVSMN